MSILETLGLPSPPLMVVSIFLLETQIPSFHAAFPACNDLDPLRSLMTPVPLSCTLTLWHTTALHILPLVYCHSRWVLPQPASVDPVCPLAVGEAVSQVPIGHKDLGTHSPFLVGAAVCEVVETEALR